MIFHTNKRTLHLMWYALEFEIRLSSVLSVYYSCPTPTKRLFPFYEPTPHTECEI